MWKIVSWLSNDHRVFPEKFLNIIFSGLWTLKIVVNSLCYILILYGVVRDPVFVITSSFCHGSKVTTGGFDVWFYPQIPISYILLRNSVAMRFTSILCTRCVQLYWFSLIIDPFWLIYFTKYNVVNVRQCQSKNYNLFYICYKFNLYPCYCKIFRLKLL